MTTIIGEKRKKIVSTSLIYEMIDGKPYYYKGYEKTQYKKAKLESIMGTSALQSFIILIIKDFLTPNLKQYRVMASELGLHLGLKDNLAADIAIYPKEQLTIAYLKDSYLTIPPAIVIEVDTKADLKEAEDAEYYHRKTQKLLDFGVGQVIWFYTKTQKVMVSKRGESRWIIGDWSEIIEILGCSFTLKELLEAEGIDTEKLKLQD